MEKDKLKNMYGILHDLGVDVKKTDYTFTKCDGNKERRAIRLIELARILTADSKTITMSALEPKPTEPDAYVELTAKRRISFNKKDEIRIFAEMVSLADTVYIVNPDDIDTREQSENVTIGFYIDDIWSD